MLKVSNLQMHFWYFLGPTSNISPEDSGAFEHAYQLLSQIHIEGLGVDIDVANGEARFGEGFQMVSNASPIWVL